MADLSIGEDRPTDAERAAVDAVVGPDEGAVIAETERFVRGGNVRRRSRRHLLLPALHELQHRVGWISPGGLNHVAERLGVPPAEAYGVATFYELFRTTDPGHTEPVAHVCVDSPCRFLGSAAEIDRLRADGRHVHESPCLGLCDRAPGVFVQGCDSDDHVPGDATEALAVPQAGDPTLRVLRRVGVVDPGSLESYRANGGYRAMASALQMGPEAICEAIAASGLTGRGGAAFPTAVKWRAVAAETGRSKHVVANCDESEPGTFKDRTLMEHDPFALVEALTIAGVATGAAHGWIYIRGEYPRATTRLRHAISEAHAAGLLGDDIAGSGHRFTIELRRGAGAYICGEETALFNSIEGFRGEPRNKPPFPTTHGLFGEPTAVNNPETLLNVLDIVTDGPDAYRSVGTEASPGTRLFCLSGHIGRPGLYEAPFGITLGELLALADGCTGNPAAVLLGGAAGMFVTPDHFDIPLTLENTRGAGLTLGSGVVMVIDDTVDLTGVVTRIAEFFRNESCGQCVPCRVGTQRQYEVLVELTTSGSLSADRRVLIDDMAVAMADASICGLGHTAASAVRSAIDLGLVGADPALPSHP